MMGQGAIMDTTEESAQPKETEEEDPNNSMSMLSGACSVALALEAAAAAALAAGTPAGLKPCEGPEARECLLPYSDLPALFFWMFRLTSSAPDCSTESSGEWAQVASYRRQ